MKPASSANEACFICHRDYIHFSVHFPTLFSSFIGKHYLCKIFPFLGKLTEHK